jgi:hypothetical protein
MEFGEVELPGRRRQKKNREEIIYTLDGRVESNHCKRARRCDALHRLPVSGSNMRIRTISMIVGMS